MWQAVRDELERELTRRWREIAFFSNQLARFSDQADRRRYRRALVVMVYAHFEGFFRFALRHYTEVVNGSGLPCGECVAAVLAASWREVFADVERGESKSSLFRRRLPDDAKLHRVARRRRFVERLNDLHALPVRLDDQAVDTESNLTPLVVKRNLYVLGLDHEAFERHRDSIHRLVNYRNEVAHGSRTDGFTRVEFEKLKQAPRPSWKT